MCYHRICKYVNPHSELKSVGAMFFSDYNQEYYKCVYLKQSVKITIDYGIVNREPSFDVFRSTGQCVIEALRNILQTELGFHSYDQLDQIFKSQGVFQFFVKEGVLIFLGKISRDISFQIPIFWLRNYFEVYPNRDVRFHKNSAISPGKNITSFALEALFQQAVCNY